jgi:MraZ protein
MFLGQYSHSLDDKGRLTIPVVYRDGISEGAVISQGFDKNLMVMSNSYFEMVSKRLDAMNLIDPATRLLRRMIMSTAFQVEIDKNGRVLVPTHHRQFLGGANELVLVGQGPYFEIWTPEFWAEQSANINYVEANTQRFAALDLSAKE